MKSRRFDNAPTSTRRIEKQQTTNKYYETLLHSYNLLLQLILPYILYHEQLQISLSFRFTFALYPP